MGYMHIENLYKVSDWFLDAFKYCYVSEKIHGTSAHITWKANEKTLSYSPGGEKLEKFKAAFNCPDMEARFGQQFPIQDVTIYGEAYGGSCQGMSATYGKTLKFVVFDVMVGDCYLDTPSAEKIAVGLGLDFVHYVKCKNEIEVLNEQRDAPSAQAIKNGCGLDKKREGIVIRPLVEFTRNNGARVIAKHKRDEFKETKTPRDIDPAKLKVLHDAESVAEEWVTEMRLLHVLNKNPDFSSIDKTGSVISAMLEDVQREAGAEVEWSEQARRAIGKRTALLFKTKICKIEAT